MVVVVFRRGLTQVVAALVVCIVVILIGAILIGQLQTTALQMDLNVNATAVVNRMFNQVWGSYNLLTIFPIIIVAGSIIGLIVSMLGVRRKE